jgi:uncharacterized protein YqgV (UPF0045/DUF77 family)
MKVTLEISMYPLTDAYKDEVKNFLRRLHQQPNIELITNGVSTQVFGEYDDVITGYNFALKPSIESGTPISVVTKIINSHLPPDRWDTSQWA